MKKVFTFVLMSILTTFIPVNATDVSGTLISNATWTFAQSPYIVTGNITVNTGVTLKIDSGVIVKFNSNLGIYVNGTLKARKAQFTSNVTPLAKGAWSQIQSNTSTSIVTLDTCNIAYGGYSNNGIIYAYLGTVNLNNTSISNSSSAGIELNNSTVNIKNSSISGCDWPLIYANNSVLHNNGGNNFTGNKHDAAYIYFTNLGSNWNLELLAIPYVFYSSFSINSTGNMTIASGNSLKSSSWIYVDGILNAVADKNQKIIFTSANNDNVGGDTNSDGTATYPARGSWGGIYFRNSSIDASCVLKRCDITFGGSGNRGGIVIENANTTVDSCYMANNYYGAEISGVSYPNFKNNTMASSQVVPIAMSFDANPVFQNNSFSFSDNQYDAIGLLGGTLGANSHLIQRHVTGIPNVTYLMLGDLTIPQNYTLTIDTGIVVKSTYYGITVKGALIANGGAGSRQIIFTSVKDDFAGNPIDTNKDGTQTNPTRTDWRGIIFEDSSDDSKCILNYCQVKYATSYGYYGSNNLNGAINTVNASPTITNCIIKDATYGLIAYQASNPIVRNTEFTNAQYTPIAISVSANPTFENIKFTNNAWTALGLMGETVGINGTIGKRNIAGYTNISYVLLGNMTINSGINVTVSPGIVIKMQNNIYVDGGLKADALVNDSITFTSINDDNYGVPKDTRNDGNATAPAKGNWGSIYFRATTDDIFSRFNYCNIFYGGSDGNQGNLSFIDAGNTISNTIISDSYNYGMRIDGSSTPDCTNKVTVKNCRLDPIAMSLTSNPKFNFTSPLFASLGNGSNGIRIIEGNLSTNATLTRRDVGGIKNVAYIIDNLTIMPNTTLTIGEGVVLKFSNYYNNIIVNGALVADGSVALPIVFTSVKDDSKGGDTNGDGNSSAPAKGNWDKIQFNSSGLDASNLLRNCIFNYGGSGYNWNGSYDNYGNVTVFNAKLLIDSCKIELSSTCAIGVFGSATPTIQNSEINNINYTPIILSMFSNPTFSNIKTSNIGINAIGVAKENYSVDATIPKRDFAGYTNMTYYLYGTCSVNSGTHITIPQGVVFKSDNISVFDVSGYLTVNGTVAQPVVFTNMSDDTYGNPLDTNNNGTTVVPNKNNMSGHALTFQDISNDLSEINYAVFNYFDRGVQLLQASPSIQQCLFQNSKWGVILNGVSTPKIDNSSFKDLVYTPICISLVSYPATSAGNSISGTTFKAIGVLSEELVQDARLEKKTFAGIINIPYYFSGNYTVGTSVTLTINPGVVCKFADWALLNVKRGLLAQGGSSADSMIVFTSYKDDFYGGDTNSDSTATNPKAYYHWSGINFEDVALDNLCKLDHCIIKYTGYYSTDGGISMSAASPTITNCLISENTNGIVINGASNPKINNCDFFNNTTYAVNNVNKAFNVDATNNWWGDNSGPTHASNPGGKGGLISDKVIYSPWKTTGSTNPLTGDVSLNGVIQAYDASLVLQKVVNLITLSPLQLKVADVSSDGNVTSFDASLILQYVAGINSVFPGEMKVKAVQNDVILSYGSVTVNPDHTFTVPVIVENASQSIALDIASTFDRAVLEPISVTAGADTGNRLFASNIDKNTGVIGIGIAGTDRLNSNAVVANITFKPAANMAANTVTTLGIDKFLANETDYSPFAIPKVIQIGELASGFYSPTDNVLFGIYPNPVKSASKVYYNVPSDGTRVSIRLFDITGKQVEVLVNATQNAGRYSIDLNKKTGGIYFLRMTSGNESSTQKVIVE